ncbi:MAG: hypothetical protein Q8941_18080 [Bacteroidota bacterium]|nr:hypothetical protein [Bacteroidota bacterium]
MAQLLSAFPFTGTIDNLSFYKMRGSDKIVIRKKGGPRREQVKSSPSFDIPRRNNAEFGGRSQGGKWVISMLWPQKALADYNIIGPLNSLIKPIQELDKESEFGQRNICFTKNPGLLQGFSLNKRNPFDSITRNPVSWSVSRDSLSASLEIPAMLPGINFYVPGKYPMYRFVAALGIVPDLFYTSNGYKPAGDYHELRPDIQTTSWYPVMNGSPATILEMKMTQAPPDTSFSLLLSVGISFGTMGEAGTVNQLKHTGAAKILAMG